ncbi:TPA: hypothetical protein EYP66_08725 [Candidatus Poribacteria bacterium]|nr:hypothetical protein [Candidatus Poribacteria bacterium]
MKELDIEQFIEDGYLLIRQDELRDYSSVESAEHFVSNIIDLRREMKKFFERPLEEKALFKIGHDLDSETKCYYAGWWEKSPYLESRFGIDYPLEYYVSRNFYGSTAEDICYPSNEGEEVRQIAASLPSQQTFSFARFLNEYFIIPILREYSRECGLQRPEPSLQIQTTYYEVQSLLKKHQDRSFLEGIVGPASGIAIFPGGGAEKMDASLEAGEVILYTGKQFQKHFQRAPRVPPPLPHAVEAESGRMSLLFAGWMPSLE